MTRIVYRCDFCEERFANLEDAEKCEQLHKKLAIEDNLEVVAITPTEGGERTRIFIRDEHGLVFEYVLNRGRSPFRLSIAVGSE